MVWKELITLVILFIIYCIIIIYIYIHIRYRRMTYSNFCGSGQMHISHLLRCFYYAVNFNQADRYILLGSFCHQVIIETYRSSHV